MLFLPLHGLYKYCTTTSGSSLGKVNTLTDANRTITYGYNAQDGLVSSVQLFYPGNLFIFATAMVPWIPLRIPTNKACSSFSYSGGLGPPPPPPPQALSLSNCSSGNQTISLGWNGKAKSLPLPVATMEPVLPILLRTMEADKLRIWQNLQEGCNNTTG